MGGAWLEPPEWLKKKDYRYLRNLNAAGWLAELQRCAQLQNPIDLREWDAIGEPDWTKNVAPAYIGPPAVQVVDRADQSVLDALEKPALIVQINLRAPDGVIMEQ